MFKFGEIILEACCHCHISLVDFIAFSCVLIMLYCTPGSPFFHWRIYISKVFFVQLRPYWCVEMFVADNDYKCSNVCKDISQKQLVSDKRPATATCR